jgi:xanthine/CO dehydrogenase XdhC/CoxF family maturation factor
MKEIRQIVATLNKEQNATLKYALATVVFIEGSAYRKPGARMLINEKGESIGAISGGCLEEDVVRKAIFVMMKAESQLIRYQTTDDEEATNAYRLGCNGTIHVLIEPILPNQENQTINFLQKIAPQNEPSVLCTLFSMKNSSTPPLGSTCLFDGNQFIGEASSQIIDELQLDIKTVFNQQQSAIKEYSIDGVNQTAFLEFIQPVITLNIFGAGYDVLPVIEMAKVLGWKINVINKRPKILKTRGIDQFTVANPEKLFDEIDINNRTAFVLLSHNYDYDKDMLRELLKNNLPYIGMLGPKNKLAKFVREFREEGLVLSEEEIAQIHSPIGLDIGSESAEEIALAIMAEVKSVFSDKESKALQKLVLNKQ